MSQSPQAVLSLLVAEFERRRWRDVDQAALRIVRALEETNGLVDYERLAKLPSQGFLAKNDASRAEVRVACERALASVALAVDREPIIPIESIDSFAAAAAISPQSVVEAAARGLPIPETRVKEYIARIIGEPFLDTDWGGELSDISTSRVVMGGERIEAAFLLKGSGSKRKLRPRDLGANGDQIRRLSKQKARLYVVQHVGAFDESVRDELRDMVLARRAEGDRGVVGSIWDGSDCARLFVAHGLIDVTTGEPIS